MRGELLLLSFFFCLSSLVRFEDCEAPGSDRRDGTQRDKKKHSLLHFTIMDNPDPRLRLGVTVR
jgi:hypothetical protein